jgi:hypothetical protein
MSRKSRKIHGYGIRFDEDGAVEDKITFTTVNEGNSNKGG